MKRYGLVNANCFLSSQAPDPFARQDQPRMITASASITARPSTLHLATVVLPSLMRFACSFGAALLYGMGRGLLTENQSLRVNIRAGLWLYDTPNVSDMCFAVIPAFQIPCSKLLSYGCPLRFCTITFPCSRFSGRGLSELLSSCRSSRPLCSV